MLQKILDNKIFRIIYNIIKWFFIGMMVLYLAFILVQKVSNNSSIGGYRLFTVLTGSMKGVYNVNDVIVVKNYDTDKLVVGDDVAYLGEKDDFKGKIVTHRIVQIEQNSNGEKIFHTKAVANELVDPTVSSKQIMGKVTRKLFIISLVNHIVKSQVGFFFLIFVPLVLVIFLEIADTIVDAKLEKEELIKRDK